MGIKTHKAFTIIELLVAMALVVILVALSSVIFAAAVRAHRMADSTLEISRRAEVIAEQLLSDVRGLRKGAPLAIRFERDATTGVHYDQILFFANGNFQTIHQYEGKTVWGNLSRIYYGHAWETRYTAESFLKGYRPSITGSSGQELPVSQLLSRRAHVLTSDLSLPAFPDSSGFVDSFKPLANNTLETDRLSLTEWENLLAVSQQNSTVFLLRNFFNQPDATTTGRPMIDKTFPQSLHLLLSEYISAFKVQWGYTAEDLTLSATDNEPVLVTDAQYFTGMRWWPSVDPAGDGSVGSDFDAMGGDEFGVYFQLPRGTTLKEWSPSIACRTNGVYFRQHFFPRALKFTFVVHDKNGLFPDGKTFTQIVAIK